MDITGKIVLITGASEGIGKATALLFAKEGARLALAARSENRLRAVAKEAGDALVILADMTCAEDVRRMVQATHDYYGRIDVLINNAGQGMYRPVEQIHTDDLEYLMRLNVYGPLIAMQEAVRIMRGQGGGTIINVSSIVSKSAIPNVGGYAATKYALNGLSLTLRNEVGKDGIIVSLVHPGPTATSFPEHTFHTEAMLHSVRGNLRNVDPPEKVAETILQAYKSGIAESHVQDNEG